MVKKKKLVLWIFLQGDWKQLPHVYYVLHELSLLLDTQIYEINVTTLWTVKPSVAMQRDGKREPKEALAVLYVRHFSLKYSKMN